MLCNGKRHIRIPDLGLCSGQILYGIAQIGIGMFQTVLHRSIMAAHLTDPVDSTVDIIDAAVSIFECQYVGLREPQADIIQPELNFSRFFAIA